MAIETESAHQRYARILKEISQEVAQLNLVHLKLVWARTLLFFAALGSLVLGYSRETINIPVVAIGWLLAAGFLVAIVWHEHVRLKQLWQQDKQSLYNRLLARLDRRWNDLPIPPAIARFRPSGLDGSSMSAGDTNYRANDSDAMADDLDVFGKGSLLQFLSLGGTAAGHATLRHWLTDWSDWPTIQTRQRAVRVLAEQTELREEILLAIAQVSEGQEDLHALPTWAAGERWLPKHRLAHVLSIIGPTIVIAAIIGLLLALVLESSVAGKAAAYVLASGFALNLVTTIGWSSWLHDIFSRINGKHRDVYQFQSVFARMVDLPQDNGILDKIRHVTCEGPNNANEAFRKLTPLVKLANLQRDVLLYVLYLVLQLVLLWDFRILEFLERWQQRFGACAGQWFAALGEFEALLCSATIAYEYPQWSFARPNNDPQSLLAVKDLGHPLLKDRSRVCNDLTIIRAQPLLLVTGSNMAGKSTLLRSVGLNELLNRTGAPVCASSMQTPANVIATSIRVRDSLQDGVSFFMAELHRLKMVVDIAEQNSRESNRPVLFLLDEILQGTNSRERQIAVLTVIERLLKCGAVGAVSTHDLDLAAIPEIQRIGQIVHFREYFEQVDGHEAMRFDYKMQPGPTPTTNALRLLKLVGLDHQ